MSVQDLERAYELIKLNFSRNEINKSGKKSKLIIEKAEEILEVKLPKTYKFFLIEQGFGGPKDLIIYGLVDDSIENLKSSGFVWGIIEDRKSLEYPHHILRIYDIGDGSTYCLDTSQMNQDGECPVVVWPLGGYEETPVLEIVAEDFGKFFLDMVKQQIEYKKENS